MKESKTTVCCLTEQPVYYNTDFAAGVVETAAEVAAAGIVVAEAAVAEIAVAAGEVVVVAEAAAVGAVVEALAVPVAPAVCSHIRCRQVSLFHILYKTLLDPPKKLCLFILLIF